MLAGVIVSDTGLLCTAWLSVCLYRRRVGRWLAGEFLCVFAHYYFLIHLSVAESAAVRFGLVVPEHSGRAFSLSRSYPRCVPLEKTPRVRPNSVLSVTLQNKKVIIKC